MEAVAASLKLFAYVILALLAGAAGYIAITALRYWPAINV